MLTDNEPFHAVSNILAIVSIAIFALLAFLPTIGMYLAEGTFLPFSNGFTQRAVLVSLILALPYLVNHYYLPTKIYLCKLLSKS